MELEHINRTVGAYLTRFPAERERLSPLVRALAETTSTAPISRQSPAHITAGAVVIDPACRRVLQIRHRRLNQWLLPGGHVESTDRSLPEAAHRELAEETGDLGRQASLALDYPVDIDVHVIPAQPERGEPEHVHFDFRYAFTMSMGDIDLAIDEVEEFRWTAIDAFGKLGQRVGDLLDDV